MKRAEIGFIRNLGLACIAGAVVFAGLAVGISTAAEGPAITVTILYDNYAFVPGLQTDWGFACLVRGFDKTVLFDTGTNPALFLGNLKALGIEPSTVDVVFISHGHGDHTGGLAAFLKLNNKVTVWLPGSVQAELSEVLDQQVKSAGARVVRNREPTEVCPGVRSTGELPRVVPEQALIIDTSEGAVVITGCAHPGILDILRRAREVTNREIALVVGGFHLLATPEPELRAIIRAFKDELGVKRVAATHCTGDAAIALFKEAYGPDFIPVGAGKVLTLAKGSNGGGA